MIIGLELCEVQPFHSSSTKLALRGASCVGFACSIIDIINVLRRITCTGIPSVVPGICHTGTYSEYYIYSEVRGMYCLYGIYNRPSSSFFFCRCYFARKIQLLTIALHVKMAGRLSINILT